MNKTPRFIVYSHLDTPMYDLDPDKILYAQMTEEINGEHSLTISTTQELVKQQRIIMKDEQGKVREWVVTGIDATHTDFTPPFNTYYCVWSLQNDLGSYICNRIINAEVSSITALEYVLEGTSRWTRGTVTQNTQGKGSMYYMSAWEALGVLVQNWGGEVDADIEIDGTTGAVVSRTVSLYNQLGTGEAVRRFDYAHDMQSITRTVADQLWTCRITPRGKGVETENGGYGRRITIADVNPTGEEWIQDDEVVSLVQVPDGEGGYEYPNQIVVFENIDDPQALYDYALAHLTDYTHPRVTYQADISQFAQAGMDATALGLGDVGHCVDRGFSEEGVRVEGRVLKLVTDLVGERQ